MDYLNVKSSPVNFSMDEIRELQVLVVEMKKEIKELKAMFRMGVIFTDQLLTLKFSRY